MKHDLVKMKVDETKRMAEDGRCHRKKSEIYRLMHRNKNLALFIHLCICLHKTVKVSA